MRTDLILSPWEVLHRGGELRDDFLESIFFTGSGRMGARGYLPCCRAEYPVQTGLYVAGIFGQIKPGITDFVNLPTPLCEDCYIDGEAVTVTGIDRRLDMRRSLVSFDYTLSAAGKSAHMTCQRFFPKNRTGLCLQRTCVTSDAPVSLRIESGVMTDCCNSPIPDDQTKDNIETVQLAKLHAFSAGSDGFICDFDIIGTGLEVSEQCRFSAAPDSTVNGGGRIVSDFSFALAPGEAVTLDKLCFIGTSRDIDPCIAPIEGEWSFDSLLAEHEKAWESAWNNCDFDFTDDAQLQCALRYSMYQLLCSCSRNDPTVSIGARGLTHGRYKGCYFWDTDMFMLPFYLSADQTAAKSLCEYRARSLPAAKEHSKRMNTLGARYPWMAALDGSEQCETWDIGCSELHVTADVVYALDNYCRVTGDNEFYLDRAAEVYIETARFWMSRYTYRPESDTADLLFCKGPDEYCGVINNNLYTNVMVQHDLTLAYRAANDMKKHRPEAYSRLGVNDDEVSSWLHLRDIIKWPHDPCTGHLTTDDSFHLLEPVDISSLKQDLQASYHAVCFDRLQRYRVVKQADVLLLMTRLPELFTKDEKLTAWNDFEPICLHDSTLSFASHALFAVQNGLSDAARDYLGKALLLDLRDMMGSTGKEGLHLACMGEAWQAAKVMGKM